jgi:PAS domain S-box-containing protein
LLLGGLALTLLSATLRRQESLVGEHLGDVVLAEELASVSNRASRKARDYLLTGDAAHLQGMEDAGERFLALHAQMAHGQPHDGERELLQRVRTEWEAAWEAKQRAIAARQRTGRLEGEVQALLSAEVLPTRERFDAGLEALVEHERKAYQGAHLDANAAAGRAWWLLTAGFLAATAAALGLGGLLVRALRGRERAEAGKTSLLTREQEARHEAQEALALLDTLIATAPVGMAFMDEELRFVKVNQVLADINGAPVPAHLGRTLAQVTPQLAPHLEPFFRRTLAGESILGVEFPGSSGGTPRHWLVSFYPVRNRAGRVFMGGTVVVDITERKRAEEELQRTAQFRERLIGIVSHDLRTPLTAISTAASLLLRSEGMPEKALVTVGRLQSSAQRMAGIISELLDFTRVRLGGGIAVQRADADLYQVARQAVEEAEMASPGRQVRLEARGDFRGRWDAGRLAQVVGNLLKNALTYSPPDTPVTVMLGEEGDWVRLVVCNQNRDGKPIPQERLPTLFDPFRRGGTEHTETAPEGLGLGLYIARELVAAHGGFIDVTSTERDGTTFTLRLPRGLGRNGHAPPAASH